MWFFIIGFTGAAALFALSRPTQSFSQKPPSLNDIKVPHADEGSEMPAIFGTMDMEAPFIGWYGDYKAKAIRKSGGKK